MRMKRTLCLVLFAVLAVASLLQALPALPASAEEPLVNIARGCSYTSSDPYILDLDKNPGTYRDKKYNELTDGVKGHSLYGPEWYAYNGANAYTVTVDLGSVRSGITRLAAEFCDNNGAAVYLPVNPKFSGSTDGKTFTDIGKPWDAMAVKGAEKTAYHTYYLDLDQSVSYRYIRLTFDKGGFFVFLSEVEVFTGYVSDLIFREGDAYRDTSDNTVCGLHAETTVGAFLSQLNTRSGVTLLDAKGNAKTTGLVATGDVLEKKQASGSTTRLPVIILGDVNGDGKVNATDYMLLKRHVLQTYSIPEKNRKAANILASDAINATDYMLLKRHVLGTYNIYGNSQGAADEGGRGDVTSEYRNMDTSDKIETLTSHAMTFSRTAETTYSVTCQTYGGTLLLTFYRTGWGTYNLGKWQLTDGDGSHTFIAGATDWEYVYRVAPSASAGWVWSGGNHANEKLRSLHFYDGKTNKELPLSVGQSVSVENLKIVEETTLYWDPAGSDGKYNYSESNRYCDAVRTYAIVGPQIRLAVDYDYCYGKDAYYDTSYTCMFPIEKLYGLYCAFLDGKENLLSVVETLKKGDPTYNGKQYDGNAAERCVVWGYDGREKYKFDVRVLTPDTSCNNFDNKMKVSFWDMNTTTNKIYFSKFPKGNYAAGSAGSAKQKVSAGSQIHTECQWTFYE